MGLESGLLATLVEDDDGSDSQGSQRPQNLPLPRGNQRLLNINPVIWRPFRGAPDDNQLPDDNWDIPPPPFDTIPPFVLSNSGDKIRVRRKLSDDQSFFVEDWVKHRGRVQTFTLTCRYESTYTRLRNKILGLGLYRLVFFIPEVSSERSLTNPPGFAHPTAVVDMVQLTTIHNGLTLTPRLAVSFVLLCWRYLIISTQRILNLPPLTKLGLEAFVLVAPNTESIYTCNNYDLRINPFSLPSAQWDSTATQVRGAFQHIITLLQELSSPDNTATDQAIFIHALIEDYRSHDGVAAFADATLFTDTLMLLLSNASNSILQAGGLEDAPSSPIEALLRRARIKPFFEDEHDEVKRYLTLRYESRLVEETTPGAFIFPQQSDMRGIVLDAQARYRLDETRSQRRAQNPRVFKIQEEVIALATAANRHAGNECNGVVVLLRSEDDHRELMELLFNKIYYYVQESVIIPAPEPEAVYTDFAKVLDYMRRARAIAVRCCTDATVRRAILLVPGGHSFCHFAGQLSIQQLALLIARQQRLDEVFVVVLALDGYTPSQFYRTLCGNTAIIIQQLPPSEESLHIRQDFVQFTRAAKCIVRDNLERLMALCSDRHDQHNLSRPIRRMFLVSLAIFHQTALTDGSLSPATLITQLLLATRRLFFSYRPHLPAYCALYQRWSRIAGNYVEDREPQTFLQLFCLASLQAGRSETCRSVPISVWSSFPQPCPHMSHIDSLYFSTAFGRLTPLRTAQDGHDDLGLPGTISIADQDTRDAILALLYLQIVSQHPSTPIPASSLLALFPVARQCPLAVSAFTAENITLSRYSGTSTFKFQISPLLRTLLLTSRDVGFLDSQATQGAVPEQEQVIGQDAVPPQDSEDEQGRALWDAPARAGLRYTDTSTTSQTQLLKLLMFPEQPPSQSDSAANAHTLCYPLRGGVCFRYDRDQRHQRAAWEDTSPVERLGSNMFTLLCAEPSVDLTFRDFSRCLMPFADAGSANLRGSVFTNAVLQECDLSTANLREVLPTTLESANRRETSTYYSVIKVVLSDMAINQRIAVLESNGTICVYEAEPPAFSRVCEIQLQGGPRQLAFTAYDTLLCDDNRRDCCFNVVTLPLLGEPMVVQQHVLPLSPATRARIANGQQEAVGSWMNFVVVEAKSGYALMGHRDGEVALVLISPHTQELTHQWLRSKIGWTAAGAFGPIAKSSGRAEILAITGPHKSSIDIYSFPSRAYSESIVRYAYTFSMPNEVERIGLLNFSPCGDLLAVKQETSVTILRLAKMPSQRETRLFAVDPEIAERMTVLSLKSEKTIAFAASYIAFTPDSQYLQAIDRNEGTYNLYSLSENQWVTAAIRLRRSTNASSAVTGSALSDKGPFQVHDWLIVNNLQILRTARSMRHKRLAPQIMCKPAQFLAADNSSGTFLVAHGSTIKIWSFRRSRLQTIELPFEAKRAFFGNLCATLYIFSADGTVQVYLSEKSVFQYHYAYQIMLPSIGALVHAVNAEYASGERLYVFCTNNITRVLPELNRCEVVANFTAAEQEEYPLTDSTLCYIDERKPVIVLGKRGMYMSIALTQIADHPRTKMFSMFRTPVQIQPLQPKLICNTGDVILILFGEDGDQVVAEYSYRNVDFAWRLSAGNIYTNHDRSMTRTLARLGRYAISRVVDGQIMLEHPNSEERYIITPRSGRYDTHDTQNMTCFSSSETFFVPQCDGTVEAYDLRRICYNIDKGRLSGGQRVFDWNRPVQREDKRWAAGDRGYMRIGATARKTQGHQRILDDYS